MVTGPPLPGRGLLGENRAVRLLRAKAAELETRVLENTDADGELSEIDALAADIALIAGLMADEIEYRHTGRPVAL